eukprot:6198673-Pleurochrysis_carterae.AAC.4
MFCEPYRTRTAQGSPRQVGVAGSGVWRTQKRCNDRGSAMSTCLPGTLLGRGNRHLKQRKVSCDYIHLLLHNQGRPHAHEIDWWTHVRRNQDRTCSLASRVAFAHANAPLPVQKPPP